MKVNLPNFRKALEKHSQKLPTGTYWRYSNGRLPAPLGQLLLEDPELAAALAADAAALAKSPTAPADDVRRAQGGEVCS